MAVNWFQHQAGHGPVWLKF